VLQQEKANVKVMRSRMLLLHFSPDLGNQTAPVLHRLSVGVIVEMPPSASFKKETGMHRVE
jgi:hypothetical protein